MNKMKNYMEDFAQTGKTMLFERFAEYDQEGKPVSSLKLLLQSGNVKTDGFFNKVERTLGVRSFEEFTEKFMPFIYEEVYTNPDTGEIKVSYTLEKPKQWEEDKNPMALDMQAFYQMVEQLYQNRKNSAEATLTFDYQAVSRLICPAERFKSYKELRASMEYYMDEYYRLEEKEPGVPSQEKNQCAQIVMDARMELQSRYQSGVTEILPLQLADAQALLIEQSRLTKGDTEKEHTSSLQKGIPAFDREGNLKVIPIEQKKEDYLGIESDEQKEPKVLLLETLKSDFEAAVPKLAESKEITDLVLSTVSSARNRNELSTEVIQKRIDRCEALYKEWNESLAETIAPLVEKFIGVRAFFDNATVDGRLEGKNLLIVANCNAQELMQGKEAAAFEEFLLHVNDAKKEKIWFGIVPAVALGDEVVKGKMKQLSPLSPIGAFEQEEQKPGGLVPSVYARQLMEICAKARMVCFYNYKANENTCFGSLTKERMVKMRDKITFSDGSYAVCCLPNFTILPKDQTNIVINQELLDSADIQRAGLKPKPAVVQIPGIYTEASYIAAGMTVGSQQTGVLKDRFMAQQVARTLPGIRVDFENKKVAAAYQSNMCRESILPCPKDLEDEIMQSRFGFYFSDIEFKDEKGRQVTHCYVRNARTMECKGGKYRKLNYVLFADFIRMCIGGGRLISLEDMNTFLEQDYKEWRKFREKEEQADVKTVNSLLREGEEIVKSDEKPQIHIKYGQEMDYVEIQIEEDAS